LGKGTHWTRCTAQSRDGSFCDAPSIPEAPFPVCIPHAAELYRFIKRHTAVVDKELTNIERFVEAYGNAGSTHSSSRHAPGSLIGRLCNANVQGA
jgi:hypothetical protein